VAKFSSHAAKYLDELHQEIKEGRYEPKPVLRRWIPKPGTQKQRPLGIPVVRDRIVQGALRHVLDPLWEAQFAEHSYGFRPGRSCRDALRRVDHLLKTGRTWVVDADIQSYFDEIPQDLLMGEVEKVVADGKVLSLVRSYLQQSVMEGMKEWTPGKGTPQGAVISPLLANIYLHPVDLAIRDAGFEMTRYADDLVIQCRTEAEAQRALTLLAELLTARGLRLHPEKTRLVDANQRGGFDFLGYHFERGYRWPRKTSLAALKDKVRTATRPTCGKSLDQIIDRLNPLLRGWVAYFRHSHWTVLSDLDGWIRRRMRSILRRHLKRRGCARPCGADQVRWPIAYFRDRGLFSLRDAQRLLCQSR
jgi:RNA-directed DNA polymerase